MASTPCTASPKKKKNHIDTVERNRAIQNVPREQLYRTKGNKYISPLWKSVYLPLVQTNRYIRVIEGVKEKEKFVLSLFQLMKRRLLFENALLLNPAIVWWRKDINSEKTLPHTPTLILLFLIIDESQTSAINTNQV